jgi:hypothetical protein
MPYTPETYAWSPVKYVGESGSIPALLLCEAGGLSYVRFRVASARPYYDGWSNWVTVGLFSEHVVAADSREPAVADLLGELEREAAAQRHHISNCRRQANGQGAPAPKPCAKVPQDNGVKPPPEPAHPPGRGRRTRASGEDGHGPRGDGRRCQLSARTENSLRIVGRGWGLEKPVDAPDRSNAPFVAFSAKKGLHALI